MDILNLLSYINKVSLLAFFITTIVVGYQIYILKKEKTKEQKPSIPDFKDITKSGEVINYTQLPGSLIKKETKQVNYSKLVFLIISLLTIIILTFIVILIKKNNTSLPSQSTPPSNTQKQNKTVDNKSLVLNNISPTKTAPSPTSSLSSTPSLFPTPGISPTLAPTASLNVSPTVTPLPSPTEIILAVLSPTSAVLTTSTPGVSAPQTLPVTGGLGKGLIMIGTAITAIFLSFWF